MDCQLACEALFHVSCGLLFPDGPVPLLDQHGPCPSVSCRSRFVRGGALHGHGFVWSTLTKGDPAYTVVQVATNDLIILVAFIPIVRFLLGVSQVAVPYGTLFLSVILFVLIPLVVGTLTRLMVTWRKGIAYFESVFLPRFDHVTMVGLLLTLVIIFASQAELILRNPFHIVLIALPLVLQTLFIFTVSFGTCRLLHLPFAIAAPAGMIGASNFFELAVAVAIALFGTSSPAALATTVGVLTEVPVMLF